MENTLAPEVFLDFSSFSEAVNTLSCGENQEERKINLNLWNQGTWRNQTSPYRVCFRSNCNMRLVNILLKPCYRKISFINILLFLFQMLVSLCSLSTKRKSLSATMINIQSKFSLRGSAR